LAEVGIWSSTTHKIAVDGFYAPVSEPFEGGSQRDVRVLTCAHILDLARHAHDQAAIRKAIDQLLAPALILRSWNTRSDLRLPHCARAHTHCQRAIGAVANAAGRAHRGGGGISRWADQRRRAWVADGAGALDREWWRTRGVRVVSLEGKSERDIEQSYATRE